MNQWISRLFALSTFAVLLLTACQPKPRTFLPITGVKSPALPARVQLARESVLDYVISSSRLDGTPSGADWQLDAEQAVEGEYRYRSGDWLMLIRPDGADGNQQFLLFNEANHASWTGYVTSEGRVVDTAYAR